MHIFRKASPRFLWFALLALVVQTAAAQKAGDGSLIVNYPDVQHPHYAKRDVYFRALLKMAMEKSGVDYELRGTLLPAYSEERSVQFIENGRYDVHWLNTTPEREATLLPVRVPLYKGAIGWRALLIRPDRQAVFEAVDRVEDLRSIVFGQGHDWADVEILKSNGIPVERSPSWAGLFKMVLLDRIQAFPRSIVEIAELSRPEAEGLVVEKRLIVRYPAAYYFFVRKDNARLARALEKGLRVAIKDGSFDAHFYDHFGEMIQQLDMEKRLVLTIPNKALQHQMPLDQPELWFDIEAFLKKADQRP